MLTTTRLSMALAAVLWGLGGSASAQQDNAGCWPQSQADLQQCKQDCVKTSPSYSQCLEKCEVWYRNCRRKPGETAEQPPL